MSVLPWTNDTVVDDDDAVVGDDAVVVDAVGGGAW